MVQNNRVLLIFPGPEYHIKTEKLNSLSKSFVGTVLTSSPKTELHNTTKVGSFRYRCFNITYKNRAWSNLKYMALVVLFVLQERKHKQKYDLVVSYDPLKTGMLGVLCSHILSCKFAPEVNGVYHNEAEYLDGPRFTTSLKHMFYPLLQRLVLAKADGVKTLFPGQVDGLVGKVTRTINAFPNHVDIERFLPLPLDVEAQVVLFVGFPFKRKGVDILIEAFKRTHSSFPQWELRIVGWYPDKRILNAHIESHPDIKVIAPVEYEDMPALLSQCSIFVLPSRSEAMGRVLVESMAAGKARIGSRVDGIPYVIDDGIDGLLFENEDVADLADKLERLMGDGELRRRLAGNARRRAISGFTDDKYFENVVSFYKEVIAH